MRPGLNICLVQQLLNQRIIIIVVGRLSRAKNLQHTIKFPISKAARSVFQEMAGEPQITRFHHESVIHVPGLVYSGSQTMAYVMALQQRWPTSELKFQGACPIRPPLLRRD